MREVCIIAPVLRLLIGLAAFSLQAADQDRERLIFVEPPLRVLTQCELETAREGELTCRRNGWSRKVALAPKVGVWRGRDSQGVASLRPGDMLDVRMGIDEAGREIARFIWANLVKVEGVVQYAGRGWLQVLPLIPATIGELESKPVLVSLPRSAEFLGGATLADVRRNRTVIIIGHRVADGRVEAARILAGRK